MYLDKATPTGWPRRAIASLVTLTCLAAGVLAAAPGEASPSARRNIAPVPDYSNTCAGLGINSAACIQQSLAAINRARKIEHVKPMILPRNYATLSVAQQTFVVTNLERVDRKLKPFVGLSATLNKRAVAAARGRIDPSIPSWKLGRMQINVWGSNWSGDYGPLGSDYFWMYSDGYSAIDGNLACTSPSAPGCWGHRDNILSKYRLQPVLVAGVGAVKDGEWTSIAQLFTGGTGKRPALTYTWAQALAHGADGHK